MAMQGQAIHEKWKLRSSLGWLVRSAGRAKRICSSFYSEIRGVGKTSDCALKRELCAWKCAKVADVVSSWIDSWAMNEAHDS